MSQQCVPCSSKPGSISGKRKGQQDETTLSGKKNKNKIKPLKGHDFERATVAKQNPFFFLAEKKSVRATSPGQLFVTSTIGLHMHLQILLAFSGTPNPSSERYMVLRQSRCGVPFCSGRQPQFFNSFASVVSAHRSAYLDTFPKLRTSVNRIIAPCIYIAPSSDVLQVLTNCISSRPPPAFSEGFLPSL